jgi:HNH endonuclease
MSSPGNQSTMPTLLEEAIELERASEAELEAEAEANAGLWRQEPVGFEEFVTSRTHLGLKPLYARQNAFVHELLGGDPRMVFRDPFEAGDRARRAYQLAVALYGKGAGKDYMCSIIVCYCVHVLLCLRDPQAYLELAPGEAIDIVNVAYNAEQAKRVFFAKLVARVEAWPWLTEHFNISRGGKRINGYRPQLAEVQINEGFIEFPNKIRAWSRHAQNESYEGLNILVWLMDEASAFLSKLKRENATAIYQTLKSSASSRFGRRWVGMVISYPRHADDFTMQLLALAQARPELGIHGDGPATTWDINERTRNEPRVVVRDREVPASLAQDFQEDFEEALGRYCCEPPMAREAFFRYPQHLWDAVVKDAKPAIEWEPTVIPRELGDGTTKLLRGVNITGIRELPEGTKLYGHGDPGLTSDSFALALGYAVPATIMVTVPAGEVLDAGGMLLRKLAPEDPIDWERDVVRTVIVALIVWRPDPRRGIQVDLQNVQDTIMELRKAFPSIGHWPSKRRGDTARRPTVTFDHWNSAETIQRLQAKRVNVKDEMWSRDFQVDIYRNGRTCFYNGLVDLPDTPSITSKDPQSPGALYELERVEFIDAVKIDHPERGCFTGETRIPLLDGTAPMISELEGREVWVYSARPDGSFVPGRARGRRTKATRDLVDVLLDSGAVVRCTPEHPWMLRDGSYRAAQDLRPGIDRLMPITRTWPVNGGYERISGVRGRQLTHHMVYEHEYGPLAKGHLVHHRNEIKTDNEPENLEQQHPIRHSSDHTARRWRSDPDYREAVAAGAKRFNESAAGRRKHSEALSRSHAEGRIDYAAKARADARFRGDITLDSLLAVRDDPAALNANIAGRLIGCSRNVVIRVLREHGYAAWADFRGPNHKVRAVIPVCLSEAVAVYDLEVDEWHNFALAAGVFVHNSKDMGDAVIRVIQHACEHNSGPTMGMASAFGHKSEYASHGPMIPQENKRVDPSKTESIGQKLAREEAANRRERPLGELVPAEGTVDGKRMGFAAVGRPPGGV